ncbi:MAG TPA: M20/M25/M40 family metallo-hydrolase [Gemmatimonadaceae bacterium]|nr:M20/M25/M40 family metallo-hydrolase [Gemmatimonadaceae bacterium]
MSSRAPDIDKALAAIDEERLVKLAIDAASIASPLGDDAELARFLDEHMRAHGLRSRLQWLDPTRANVLGSIEGSGGGRRLMLNVNTENDFAPDATTVAPARVDGGWLTGAGIWNMKGALVAAIEAATAVRASGVELTGDALVAGVAAMMDMAPVETRLSGTQHTGFGAGTRHMLVEGVAADMAVVGTPTSFRMLRQQFGTSAVRIDVVGKPFFYETVDSVLGNFTDMNPAGESPIQQIADVVQAVHEWIPDYARRTAVEGVRPYVRIAGIESGKPWLPTAAEDGSIFVYVGTPPGAGLSDALDELRAVVDGVRRAKHPQLDARVELYSVNPAPFVAEDHPLVAELAAAHESVHGEQLEAAVAIWHSDSSVLARNGIPAVSYGMPGRLEPTGDESVRVADLVACARVYAELIVRVCR